MLACVADFLRNGSNGANGVDDIDGGAGYDKFLTRVCRSARRGHNDALR
ncbi:MAG: hypothetical protein ACK45R_01720 [Candidatus Kapaibacterium sp.]